MSHSEDELWGLLEQAYNMPYGAAQIALVEQVIAHADAGGFAELSFQARVQATNSYVYGGEPARSFVTFSWSLAEFDQDPVRYAGSQHTLMWQFKATVTGLTKFPEIPLDRTYAVLDEMQRRWQLGGHSLHAVYSHRHFVALHIGDLVAADEYYRQWNSAPRDGLSDCVGCDPTSKSFWLASQGRDEEAVALAEPVLGGRLTCSEQPQGILTALMKSYLRTGRLDEARDAHRRAYRLHRPTLADLGEIAHHVEFCALTGNEARAVEIVERHLGWLDRSPSPYAAMWFAAASALACQRAAAAGSPNLTLHRPAYGSRAAGPVSAARLSEELTALALDLGARFDARNGTNHQGGRVRAMLAAQPLTDHLILSPAARTRPTPAAPADPAATAPPPPEVPADAGPDELLELAEDHLRRGRRAESSAVYEIFDERYAGAELTGLQRGRRADAYGVDAATRGAMDEAEAAWRSALDLFTEAGDELRRQSTRGRIGRVLCASGRADQGLEWVESSTSYLLAHAGPARWSAALYSLGVACGDIGRIDEGLDALTRAEDHVGANLDPTLPAVIAITRAQFLGMLDRIEEARDAGLLAMGRGREADFPDGVAHGGFLAGLATERLGDGEAAVSIYDEAAAAAVDPSLRSRIRTQRAGLLAGSPRAAEVVGDLEEALAEAVAEHDDAAAALARHVLAIAYLNAGRPLDCAETAEAAMAWFAAPTPDEDEEDDEEGLDSHAGETAGVHLLSVRHLLSVAYLRLGQPDEAIAQLELIAADCAAADNPAGVGQMTEEIADILNRQDRDAAAALRYLTAAEAFRAAGQPVDQFRARRQHATSLMWADDIPAALAALAAVDELSLTLPEDDQVAWERAVLLYDGARILRADGRTFEAAVRASGSAGAFRAGGFLAQAAHSELLQAELLLAGGQAGDAAAAARRGLADLPEDVAGKDRLEEVLAAALRQQGEAGN